MVKSGVSDATLGFVYRPIVCVCVFGSLVTARTYWLVGWLAREGEQDQNT